MLNFIKIVTGTVYVLTHMILGLAGTATVVLLVLALLSVIGWNVFWFVMLGLAVTFVACVISLAIFAVASERS